MSHSRSMKDQPCNSTWSRMHNLSMNAQSFDPVLMARFPEVSSQRFTKLANTAYKSKKQYADLLNMARFEHEEKFLDFKIKSDHVDVFLMDLLSHNSYAELLVVIKIISTISHGQSFTEKDFSINKEVNDWNMLEESLICQRVVIMPCKHVVKKYMRLKLIKN